MKEWRLPFDSPGFRWLFLGQAVTALGDWVSYIFIPLLLYRMTEDPVAVGLLMICRVMPGVLLAPVVGRATARFSVLRVMMVSDAVRGVAVLGFLVAESPLAFYLLSVVMAVAGAFFGPGKFALVPKLVPERALARANGWIEGAWQFAMFLGPAVGGVVFAVMGPEEGIVFNAVTFLVSMGTLGKVRIEGGAEGLGAPAFAADASPASEVKDVGTDVGLAIEGEAAVTDKSLATASTPVTANFFQRYGLIFRALWERKPLFFIILGEAVASLGFGGSLSVLFPIVAEQVFRSEAMYGYIMSALGAGFVAGTLAGPWAQRRMPQFLVYSVTTLIGALMVFAFGWSTAVALSLAALFVLGCCHGAGDNAMITFAQQASAEKGDTTDVFALSQAMVSMMMLAGFVLSTGLAAWFGVQAAVMGLSVAPLLVGVLLTGGYLWPSLFGMRGKGKYSA